MLTELEQKSLLVEGARDLIDGMAPDHYDTDAYIDQVQVEQYGPFVEVLVFSLDVPPEHTGLSQNVGSALAVLVPIDRLLQTNTFKREKEMYYTIGQMLYGINSFIKEEQAKKETQSVN